MKKYIYGLFLLGVAVCFSSAAYAQQFTLTGKVFDKATGKVLPGASVYLPGLR